jgi:hypothetical protein
MEFKRICNYIGVNYSSGLKKLNRSISHNTAGRPTRFDKHIVEVTEDLSWRDELSLSDLTTFERIAGKWNRKLGYL